MKMPILCLTSATISNKIITAIYNKVIAEVDISSKVINLLKKQHFTSLFSISISLRSGTDKSVQNQVCSMDSVHCREHPTILS